MFDVDDTLVLSDKVDDACYLEAVQEVLGHTLDTDWTKYQHVSDAGILQQHINEQGLQDRAESINADVKNVFVEKVARELTIHPLRQVPGANNFIRQLRHLKNLSMSIATGGWYETAMMKLASAEIDISGIPIASSNDHFSRTDIMKIAAQKSTGREQRPCTYFGDGEWDKKACVTLGYNFVLVGRKTSHHQNIQDFTDAQQALAYIGL